MPVPVMRVRGNPGKPFADIEMPMYCFRCGSRTHLIQDCSCIVLRACAASGPSRELEVGECVIIMGYAGQFRGVGRVFIARANWTLIQDCSCIVLSACNVTGPSRVLEVGEVVIIRGEVYMVMWV